MNGRGWPRPSLPKAGHSLMITPGPSARHLIKHLAWPCAYLRNIRRLLPTKKLLKIMVGPATLQKGKLSLSSASCIKRNVRVSMKIGESGRPKAAWFPLQYEKDYRTQEKNIWLWP